jgi:hypothetical protein
MTPAPAPPPDDDRPVAVCSLDRWASDDLEDVCSRCGRRVYYSPRSPVREVRRLCLECFAQVTRKPTPCPDDVTPDDLD